MKDWVDWFRHASPYINAHRNQIHVMALSGEAIEHKNFEKIIHDLALLSSLGVKLVVVFGARPQIDQNLSRLEIQSQFHKGLRITNQQILPHVLEAYGLLRSELEAKLSMGIINSPMHGSKINVVSGNYVWAKPMGVNDGIDYAFTGQVRKIETQTILQALDNNSLVLIPSVGYSTAGEIFNLSYEDLAGQVASSLKADKLIMFGEQNGLMDDAGDLIHQLTVEQANAFTAQSPDSSKQLLDLNKQLNAAAQSCIQGVQRVHLLSYTHDGALLEELFTRDGIGTMVSVDPFDEIRPAKLEDVNGILELIRPLEEQGFLIKRSRERLETELDYFLVDVRDNAIIGCAALYPFTQDASGELSCFAVTEEYRREGRGDKLLAKIEARATRQNLKQIFVLTTQTEHWFLERGFTPCAQDELPGDKTYNTNRNAKVLVKRLDQNN